MRYYLASLEEQDKLNEYKLRYTHYSIGEEITEEEDYIEIKNIQLLFQTSL